jgi:alpha-D-xyloside xylohydrolase
MLGDALLVKPVTRAMADGGDTTEVMHPPGGWYDLFTGEYRQGGQGICVRTPLDRFPVFVRAGSIIPVAEGAQCAADLPLPAREILAFGGADGSFELYDDAGDGYGEGIMIPLKYEDRKRMLTIGQAKGSLPEAIALTVRLRQQDGTEENRQVRYGGRETVIGFSLGGRNSCDL